MDNENSHLIFQLVEDKNYQDGNFEFKYQKIAEIIESLYRLPIMKIMFLDEIVHSMAELVNEPGLFEINMTQVFNQVPELGKFRKIET